MSVVASTATRVSSNTSPAINRRIRNETEARVRRLASSGQAAIDARLRALDREWDIERCLEAGASSLTLLGTILAATVDQFTPMPPVRLLAQGFGAGGHRGVFSPESHDDMLGTATKGFDTDTACPAKQIQKYCIHNILSDDIEQRFLGAIHNRTGSISGY